MGLMTSSQANACTIIRMEKRVEGSNTTWYVAVNDADGNFYDVEFKDLGSDPSKGDIKTALLAELQKREKQGAPVIEVTTPEVEDKGVGETLG